MAFKFEEKIVRSISNNPFGETVIFTVSVIGSGILCGSFVNSITENNIIQWKESFKVFPTYLILGYLILVYRYNKCLYKEKLEIEKFKDDDFLKALALKELFPEYIAKQKALIKEGNIGEFTNIDDLLGRFKSSVKNGGEGE